jgi:hypothetical protein
LLKWTHAGLAASMIAGLGIGVALVFLLHWGP